MGYKEHTVESEESWSGLNLQEPVMHKWYAMEPEDFVVGRSKSHMFQAKLRLSKDRIAYTRQIYTVLDWLGDIGGLLDALTYIGQMIMFVYFHFIQGDPISYF